MDNNSILAICESMREYAITQLPAYMETERNSIKRIQFIVNNKLTSCAGRAKKRAGIVEISGPVHIQTPVIAQLVDTILHEIAHILVIENGHGYEWQQMAERIGCSAERTHIMPKARKRSELELELNDLDLGF